MFVLHFLFSQTKKSNRGKTENEMSKENKAKYQKSYNYQILDIKHQIQMSKTKYQISKSKKQKEKLKKLKIIQT